jgi:hypothetical protein
VVDTVSDLIGKVEKRTRKPRITRKMVRKMDKRGKWKDVNNEEGRERATED